MDNINLFLAHAVRLEAEAARRFDELAAMMQTHGNTEVEAVFRRMAEYSRQHLRHIRECNGFRPLAAYAESDYEWPHGEPPESAPWWGVDALIDVPAALELALESERCGMDFYADIARRSGSIKVKAMAEQFADEEAQHVGEIERLLNPPHGGRSDV